jgi:hypothetical protein
MRYDLRTLVLLTGIVPPVTAILWFHWRLVLISGICLLAIYLWVWLSLAVARFFGNLVASMMD